MWASLYGVLCPPSSATPMRFRAKREAEARPWPPQMSSSSRGRETTTAHATTETAARTAQGATRDRREGLTPSLAATSRPAIGEGCARRLLLGTLPLPSLATGDAGASESTSTGRAFRGSPRCRGPMGGVMLEGSGNLNDPQAFWCGR